MKPAIEVRRYVTKAGHEIFGEWLERFKDVRTKAKILARIDRLALGNFGDCKSLGKGLFELRIDWGPGYRVYFAQFERACVLLLGGGDKSTQAADIRRGREHLKDFLERTS